MDNSISKALIMIASVLLAIIVISFVTYTFGQMGIWATVQDDEVLTQQTNQFNREYEAYGKDLMYGVDVISCLNKVMANNDKIKKEGYVNGEKYDESYAVTASVEIKKTLQESITVYYSEEGKNQEQDADENWNSGYTLGNMSPKFKFLNSGGSNNFDTNTSLQTQYKPSDIIENKIYTLTYTWNEDVTNDEGKLRSKLGLSSDISETVKNTGKVECKSGDNKIWTKAVFKSALYDMKNRKFKCTNIKYSAETGRVNYIEFKEM